MSEKQHVPLVEEYGPDKRKLLDRIKILLEVERKLTELEPTKYNKKNIRVIQQYKKSMRDIELGGKQYTIDGWNIVREKVSEEEKKNSVFLLLHREADLESDDVSYIFHRLYVDDIYTTIKYNVQFRDSMPVSTFLKIEKVSTKQFSGEITNIYFPVYLEGPVVDQLTEFAIEDNLPVILNVVDYSDLE